MSRSSVISSLRAVERLAEAVRASLDPTNALQAAEREMRPILRLSNWRFEPEPELHADQSGCSEEAAAEPAAPAGGPLTERVVPVSSRGRLLGRLRLERASSEGEWSDDERVVIALASATLADALDLASCRLDEAHQKRLQEERLTHQHELGRRLRELRRAYTELEQVQGQLIQAEKMASIGLLASSLAHELDSPLSTILLTTEMTDAGGDRMEIESALRVINAEAGRCRDIIRNLLDFARQSSGTCSEERVRDLLERILQLMQHTLKVKHVEVHLSVPDDLPPVRVMGNQIQQVVFNLIGNSIDAMPHGGRIEIRAELGANADTLRLVFEDTGAGFDPVTLPRVFDPFFTTKEPGKGTGLGLSICAGIVRGHGGSIRAGNSAQGGAQVIIELPFRGAGRDMWAGGAK